MASPLSALKELTCWAEEMTGILQRNDPITAARYINGTNEVKRAGAKREVAARPARAPGMGSRSRTAQPRRKEPPAKIIKR